MNDRVNVASNVVCKMLAMTVFAKRPSISMMPLMGR